MFIVYIVARSREEALPSGLSVELLGAWLY